ncbi:hypothetical protein AQUSIP_09760 [Aquicella siphonis]|uniref:Sel1 repeat family protein n=1 Tax=Aquicella siphonis TaxID=254247 RepID=A0A5E4PH83_9COXI|nr:tetratricopeptide repeat protein [Aquicella siphonis]VVC75686.1 hypothetical protein AQUSIP_09760 [Aquicella siphonis]
MERRHMKNAVAIAAALCMLPAAVYAKTSGGLYMNGQWDPACSQCWPTPRTDKNNHCKPSDCAVQGYYHCQQQNPPLSVDDDPRLISLIKSGQCTYVSRENLSAGEISYLNSMKLCTQVLDKMAGRFTLPANPADASKLKVDFYLTHFKASILGSAYAQLKLAMDYDIGMGTQQNRAKATELYREAAKKGLPFAQYAIAARYAYGITVPKDKEQAIMWLNKALTTKPATQADKKARDMVEPCAIKLIERLTPT